MSKKNCVNCGKSINFEKDKYVLVGTYNGTGKARHDEQFFHFECWREYFRQCTTNKVKSAIGQASSMLNKVMKSTDINLNDEIPDINLQIEGMEDFSFGEKEKKKEKGKKK